MSAEQLDQTFFIKKVQGVHYKSAIPAVGSVRNDGTDVERYHSSIIELQIFDLFSIP